MAADDGQQHDRVSAAAGEVKERAASGAEVVQEQARERAEEWSAGLGRRAGHVADAARSAGERLRGKEDWLADAVEGLGRNLENLSTAARDKGFDGMKRDVERLARERPTLFMGAAVATGLALGRLLRSSPPKGGMHGGMHGGTHGGTSGGGPGGRTPAWDRSEASPREPGDAGVPSGAGSDAEGGRHGAD